MQAKYIFSGDGTAGHVIPALVVLKALAKRHPKSRFIYIGKKAGIAKKLVDDFEKKEQIKVKFSEINSGKLHRFFTLKNIFEPFKVIKGIWQSLRIVKSEKPNAVFLKGGYVSFPVAVAAKFYRVPIILHETDASLGLANRLIAPLARKVAISFPGEREDTKYIYTGSPVRESIYKLRGSYTGKKFQISIIGGSQGASRINELIVEIIPELERKYKVVHVTGSRDFEKLAVFKSDNYEPINFTSNIDKIMANSDLIISRAGGTIFEIAALGKPVILIPLPTTASRGEQIQNANILKSAGAAVVLKEKNLSSNKLLNKINQLLGNSHKRRVLAENISQFAQRDAADRIAELILSEELRSK